MKSVCQKVKKNPQKNEGMWKTILWYLQGGIIYT